MAPPQQPPYPPQPPNQPPFQPPYPPPPPPRRGSGRKIGCIIGLVVLLGLIAVIVVVAVQANKKDPDNAAVGDCMSREGTNSIKVASCSDAKAVYKVVGKVNDKTQVDLSLNSATICKPFAGAKSAFWKGKVGKKGYILCLAPK